MKTEKLVKGVCLMAALASTFAVLLICVFLFGNGIPAIREIGVIEFLFGTVWRPGNGEYGIFPMILGSIYVTGGAALIGVPIAILTSVFMAFYCPKKWYEPMKKGINLMAGIPSVIYGFFGMIVLVPIIKNTMSLSSGKTMLTASILLGIMILPTVIGVIEPALKAVSVSYYEGALALGASHSRAVYFVMLPAAKSAVVAGLVLGIGRAIGETMAVIMVAGNQPILPEGFLMGIRTMTANIVLEMGYATDLHREALIATGVVLFAFILVINLSVSILYNGRKANG